MKNVMLTILTAIAFTGCSNQHATYNQKLVNLHDIVKFEMEGYTTLAKEDGFTDADTALAFTQKTIDNIDKKLKEVKALKVPKTGDTLQTNIIALYNNYLLQLSQYKVFCTKTAPDADKIVAASAIDSLHTQEEALFSKLTQSQANYAAAHGFKVKQ
jgi:hypothetical protein